MTSTCSANALALPETPDRRTLLTGAALAAIVAASATVPAAARTVSPIEALFQEWRRVQKLADAAVTETCAAEEKLVPPPKPGWAPWSVSQPETIRVGEDRCRMVLQTGDTNVALLRQIIATPEQPEEFGYETRIARAQQELDQILDWRAEFDRLSTAKGLKAAQEREAPLMRETLRLADAVCAAEATSYRDLAMQAAVLSEYWMQAPVERVLKGLVMLAGLSSAEEA